jgi:peptidoglycan/xylan/chitin deacetylase (PgdA/CDA1 family)
MFCFSFDFELLWGLRESTSDRRHYLNVERGRETIPQVLEVFSEYNISATWAVVGAMFANNKSELESILDGSDAFDRRNREYLREKVGVNESDDPLHFARSLIKIIKAADRQEIATHSMFHDFLTSSRSYESLLHRDLSRAIQIMERSECKPVSIVFPRNQYKFTSESVCEELGITRIRTNLTHWAYAMEKNPAKSIYARLYRYLDAFLPIRKPACNEVGQKGVHSHSVANRFLRVSESSIINFMHLRRILGEMKRSAMQGASYHLWTHPHNLGVNPEGSVKMIKEICAYQSELQLKYDFRSVNMRDW